MASYKTNDLGVTVSSGRGAAKVSLFISFKDLDRWAERQKIDVPKMTERSFLRACGGLKKKFTQVVTRAGGVCGVPKFKDFEAFTKDLRSRSGKTTPMGGKLAEKSSVFGGKATGGWYIVGWKNYLEKAAENFQDGFGGSSAEKYFVDPHYRRIWHRQGLEEIPRSYVHNPRRVLPEPFGSYVAANLKSWAKSIYYKDLARQMQKGAK